MHKRGFIGEAFAAPWFIILFFIMLVIFLFLFTFIAPFVREHQEISSDIGDMRLSFSVVNFFRMHSSRGNVQDLFYYYLKNFDDGYFNEIRQMMKEFLPLDICVEVLINSEKIKGNHFNDCGTVGDILDTYEFVDYDLKKIIVNFYKPRQGFFIKRSTDFCSFLNSNQCLNWVGCAFLEGRCKSG